MYTAGILTAVKSARLRRPYDIFRPVTATRWQDEGVVAEKFCLTCRQQRQAMAKRLIHLKARTRGMSA